MCGLLPPVLCAHERLYRLSHGGGEPWVERDAIPVGKLADVCVE